MSAARGRTGRSEPSIEIAWATERRLLDDDALRAACRAALAHGGRADLSLSVVLVDDEALAQMHGEWLDDSSPTDVISFDLGDDSGPAGELYVSVERALAAAAERGLAPERELALYVVHGTLHLCGYDDHELDERARMRVAEAAVLDALGYAPDPRHGDA